MTHPSEEEIIAYEKGKLKMKFGAVTPVYCEEKLLKGCVRCLRPFVKEHVVCVSKIPYFGENDWKDNSAGVAKDLGATVIEGEWALDDSQRNSGIDYLVGQHDLDWIFTFDADMMMTANHLNWLIEILTGMPKHVHAVRLKQWGYWRDTNHVFEAPNLVFKLITAIRPHVRFKHIGDTFQPAIMVAGPMVHHIAWASPKDIKKKVQTYSHAPAINSDWYEKHYLTWKEGDRAKLPDAELKIKYQPLPKELEDLLND